MSYEREWERLRVASSHSEATGLPLFGEPQVRPLARRSDPDTSKDAAVKIAGGLNRIQRAVFTAYAERGPMTAKVAERLPEFDAYGYSTVRKRISELWHRGLLRDSGQRDEGCIVYEAVQSSATTREAA